MYYELVRKIDKATMRFNTYEECLYQQIQPKWNYSTIYERHLEEEIAAQEKAVAERKAKLEANAEWVRLTNELFCLNMADRLTGAERERYDELNRLINKLEYEILHK